MSAKLHGVGSMRLIARSCMASVRGRRLMAAISYKFDESYDGRPNSRTLVVGGWIADDEQWGLLSSNILDSLDFENSSLPPDKQISRYHAAEMNACSGEFEEWRAEPHRSVRMTKKMFDAVSNERMSAISCGIDLLAFEELWPNLGIPDAYALCVKYLMLEVGVSMRQYRPDDRVILFHDQDRRMNVYATSAFSEMINDPDWSDADRFVSIAPVRWQDDAGLQACDMIAYEVYRLVNKELTMGQSPVELRKPLKILLGMTKRISWMYFDRDALVSAKGYFQGGISNGTFV